MGISNSTKKKILVLTFKEGHLSIARAIESYLKKTGYQTNVYDAITKNEQIDKLSLDSFYMPFYQYFPSLFKIPFQLSQKEKIIEKLRERFEKKFSTVIRKKIKGFQPDLIISTHYAYNPASVKVSKDIPLINIVTDPRTFSYLIPEPKAEVNFVYDQQAVGRCVKAGCPKQRTRISGWFVQPEFYQQRKRSPELLKRLGFQADKLTFLICGGSEGTNAILKILPAILNFSPKVQTAIICGSNKSLYKAMKKSKDVTADVFDNYYSSENIKIFKYVENMAEFISIADLVIGKAGPNLLFETIAVGKPFFAITHISGQEDGNLEIIKNKKLGYVQENPFKATDILKEVVENQQSLNKFSQAINKERAHNQKAKEILMETVKELIGN